MRAAFRVDASNRIGTGHVIRCLTLAQALRERGAECFFIHRLHPGHLSNLIRQEGYAVEELPAPKRVADMEGEAAYAAWLGVDPAVDARQTAEAIGRDPVDWLVVDHYALDADWEQTVSSRARRIAALDDLADRQHDCDLLIDQNRIPDPERRYDGLVPDRSQRLCGPRYALIRPEYSHARELIGPRRGPLSRVLVFYGGADVQNETGRALRVLSRPEFRHLAVDVVVGVNHPNSQSILHQAQERPGTEVHGPREGLVDLMIEADLALGAGGTTTWERCALGLPSVVTAVALNQISFNRALGADGAVRYLGHWPDISDECLAGALAEYLDDPSRLAEMGQRAWTVTDGMGRWRVAETIDPSNREDLQLRRTRRAEKALYFEWANDPNTRAYSTNPEPISWATHDQWFNERIEDPKAYLWVMITPDGLPVGQVRAEVKNSEAVLDYSIDSAFCGQGWETRPLELVAIAWRDVGYSVSLGGAPNPTNDGSSQAFLRAGSPEIDKARVKEERISLTILSDRGSWVNTWIPKLITAWLKSGHRVRWTHNRDNLLSGDLCFLLGCGQIVQPKHLGLHDHTLVVHESNLPQGRGWSPLTWQIIQGESQIPVTLLEATEEVDGGDIYLQEWIEFEGHELIDELRKGVADATFNLCRQFVESYPDVLRKAQPQKGEASWWRKRSPEDSELSPHKSVADQFELLRVVDNSRYPAYFRMRHHQYKLTVEKLKNE